ncbi:PP5 [Symbiodinium natans]|uniref:PP5 protein n=1 Tax=Symbiodinium natans TaxID=878477 RepID=A0A812P4N5_9DINO|nr:PP5 [Symbiodinium natans]
MDTGATKVPHWVFHLDGDTMLTRLDLELSHFTDAWLGKDLVFYERFHTGEIMAGNYAFRISERATSFLLGWDAWHTEAKGVKFSNSDNGILHFQLLTTVQDELKFPQGPWSNFSAALSDIREKYQESKDIPKYDRFLALVKLALGPRRDFKHVLIARRGQGFCADDVYGDRNIHEAGEWASHFKNSDLALVEDGGIQALIEDEKSEDEGVSNSGSAESEPDGNPRTAPLPFLSKFLNQLVLGQGGAALEGDEELQGEGEKERRPAKDWANTASDLDRSVRATGCTELVGGPGGLGGGGWSPRRVKWAVMVGRGLLVEAIAFLVKVESDMMAVKLGVVVLEVEGVNMKLDVAEVKQVVVRLVEEKLRALSLGLDELFEKFSWYSEEDQVTAVNQDVAAADSHARSIADAENVNFIDDGRNSGRTGMEMDSSADRDRLDLSFSGPPPGLTDRNLEIVAAMDSVGRTPTLAIEDLAGIDERMEEGPFVIPSEPVSHGMNYESTGGAKGITGSRLEMAIEDRVDSLAVSSSSDHDRTIRRNDDGIDAMMPSGELGAEGDRTRSADSGHWMGRGNGDDLVPGVYSNSATMIGNVGADPTDLELIAKGSSAVAQNVVSESDDRALSVFSSTGLSEASPGGNVEALKDVRMGQTTTIGIEWGSHGIRSTLEETGVITDMDFAKFFTDQGPGEPGSTPMTMQSDSQERWNAGIYGKMDEGLRKQRAEQAVKEMNQIAESVPAAKKSKSTEIGGPIHQAGMITPDQGSEGWGNRSPAPRSPGIGGQYEHFGIDTPPEGRGRNDEMRATSSPPRRAKMRAPADPDKSSLGEIDGRIDDLQTVVVDTQTDVAKLKVASECASAIANSSAEKADVVSKRLVECEEEVKHWKGWIESQQIDTKTTLSQELKEMSRIMDGSVSEDRMDDAMAPQLTEGAMQLARRMRRQVENVKVLKTSVTTRLKGVEERLSTAEHSADIAKQSTGTKITTLETGLNEVRRGIGVVFSSMQMRHENGTWKNERLDKVETVLNRQWDQIKIAGEELRKLKSKGSQKAGTDTASSSHCNSQGKGPGCGCREPGEGHGTCIDGAVRGETKKLSEVVLAQKEHIMTVAREVIKNRKSVAEIVANMTKVHKTCENVAARTDRMDEKRNGEQAWVKDTVRKMEKTMESMSSRMIDEQKRVTGEFILVNARIDESARNEGVGKMRGNSAEIGKPPTMSRGRDSHGGSGGADGRARSDNARGIEASRPELAGPVVDRRIENRCIVLEQQVTKITSQLQGLTTVNERIVRENASLLSEIESVKGENKGVTESVARMIRDNRDEVSKMRADLDLRSREMIELKEKNEQLEATVREYERRLEQVKRNDSIKAELDSMWNRIGEVAKQSSEYAMPAPAVGGASNAGSARPSAGATPAAEEKCVVIAMNTMMTCACCAPLIDGDAMPEGMQGQDFQGGGYNKFKDTRGMEKCNEISIAKEPSSGEVGLWLGDVAHTAKAAYLYDGDYAYTQVLRVRERSEAMIDMELKYPALENQLFSGLKRAIKSESLSAKVKMEMYKTQQVGDGKPMTAMRLLTLIVKHVEIPIAKESQVLYDGLSSTKVMSFPGKPEEEALEEFMTRWDLAHTNLIGLKGNTWSEQQLGWMLHSKVQRVQVLNHDIEAWRLLPDEAKTHTWLRKRIKDRLEMWRADKNIDEASMRVSRQAFTSGYEFIARRGK